MSEQQARHCWRTLLLALACWASTPLAQASGGRDTLCAGPEGPGPLVERDSALAPERLGEQLNVEGLAAWLREERSRAEEAALGALFAPPAPDPDKGILSDDLAALIPELDPATQARLDEAREKIAELDEHLLAGDFDPDNLAAALPLGWRQSFGAGDEAVSIALAITESRLKATHAEVDLVLELQLPNAEDSPIFFADGIPWSRAGGFTGEVTLELLSDWGIPIARDAEGRERAKLRLLADAGTPETRAGGGGTFVTVSCNEVVAARLTAELYLSRDWVVPVVDGQVGGGGTARVQTGIQFDLSQGGLYATTRFSHPFAFPRRPDVVFEVGEVTVDFSSARSSGTALVPRGYESPHVKARRLTPAWQGVYIADVSARLDNGPVGEDGRPVGARAEFLLIDDAGLTVDVAGVNVLPLGEGKLGNWDFSVDTLGVRVIHSNFEAARIAGVVKVPLIEKKGRGGSQQKGPVRRSDCMGYGGVIADDGFRFTLTFPDEYHIPAWKSDAIRLAAGSLVTLGKDEKGVFGRAELTGDLDLDASAGPGGGLGLKTSGLRFTKLHLGTREPYFRAGYWTAPDIGFTLGPIDGQVEDIAVVSEDVPDEARTEAHLSFVLTLQAEDALKFDAEGGVAVVASASSAPGAPSLWRFERVSLGYFAIDASTQAFGVKGELAFYGQEAPHPVWGEGFYGSIQFDVKALKAPGGGSLGIGAVAQFGKLHEGERYFLIDVMANLEALHIPLVPPLELHGIGGGAYRNLKGVSPFVDLTAGGTGDLAQATRAFPLLVGGQAPSFLGKTLSGRSYAPSADGRIGFHVQVLMADARKSVRAGGEIEFAIVPDEGFELTLRAGVTLMADGSDGEAKRKQASGSIAAYAELQIIRERAGLRFTADVAAFVSQPPAVVGAAGNAPEVPTTYVNDAGYAGQLSIHVSEEKWYFYVGHPDYRIAVETPILGLSAYVCVGSEVPPLPRLSANIRSLTGPMERGSSLTDLADLKGFALGATAGAEELEKKIVKRWRYDLIVEVGFDVNVRNYARQGCRYAKNGGAPGLKGWYGAGQAYAYFSCKIWKDRKRRGRKDKAEVTAGAVLEMRGPNPTWVAGTAAGKIKLGFIKVKFKASFEAGKQC